MSARGNGSGRALSSVTRRGLFRQDPENSRETLRVRIIKAEIALGGLQVRACLVLFVLGGVFLRSGWNFLAWRSGGRRPLIAGCLSLQRLRTDLPVTRPAWEWNLRPPASESRPLTG